MAKQSAPAAAEPAAKEPVAEPAASQPAPAPTIEELQAKLSKAEGALAELSVELNFQRELVASKEASLEELASKLADAREHASNAEQNALRVAELERLVGERDETIRDLAFKLADAHDKTERSASAELAPLPPKFATITISLDPSQRYRCVALRRMRTVEGWVSHGEEFEALGEQLEGYVHGEHFVTKD